MHKCEIIGCTTGEEAVVAVAKRRYTEEAIEVMKVILVCAPHAEATYALGWHVKAAA